MSTLEILPNTQAKPEEVRDQAFSSKLQVGKLNGVVRLLESIFQHSSDSLYACLEPTRRVRVP